MCVKVGVILPRDLDITDLMPLIEEHHLSFTYVDNQIIQRQLPGDEVFVKATNLSCECFTGIGSYDLYIKDFSPLYATIDNVSTLNLMKEEELQKKKVYMQTAAEWMEIISNLLIDYKIKRVGLFWHFCFNDIENEDFKLIRGKTYQIEKTDYTYLMKIKENEAVYFN